MAQVVSYDVSKLPSAVQTPSKYPTELLVQYTDLITKGKGAGDGADYATQKEARAAANSIKRAIRKHINGDLSIVMRLWSTEDKDKAQVFHFALSQNTRELTGAAAAARASRGE